ncbi:GMC family oxidoreductase [Streptomonospora nanhaiensis]|uniref:Choline dehydrogenase-like flavoprotein n=1 Tax=Streptomonospora nanhaiensis TaxID=1323731 RepID=A0A853BMX7_9ACTN|nr:FAD-dependent oxidoreductase [Streptomonospora nanhaiensis]NYI96017.1 choline dehydrogenase-like flavoprotein [Streptomonospora nanhaiensis]
MENRLYDFVIVGAGSAGCVLASRLSADPGTRVLLIEAGPADTAPELRVPMAWPTLFKTPLDWDYATEPEPGLDGRRRNLPLGRVLGGSSSINAMIYMRGNPADYRDWEKAGAEGWDWDGVLPYFKRAEDNERGADDHHGAGGPLKVGDLRTRHPLMEAFIEAGEQAGHVRNPDFNGASQDGFGWLQVTQSNGLRFSAADAYLRAAEERPNLTVMTDTQVNRVVVENGRAVGVELVQGAEVRTVRAEREVIVSAGAYNSPKLLQLSGIGRAAELAAFGIEPVADLPVGENLQDHVFFGLVYRTDVESLSTAATPENQALLMTEGRGPLTSNIAEAAGLVRTRPDLEAPDIQIHAGPIMLVEEGLGIPVHHAFTVAPTLLRPTSRGRVFLRSPNPAAKPRILHNYLTTAEDRETVVRAVRASLEVAAQPALAAHRGEPISAPEGDDDASILRFARHVLSSIFHPVGTCAIGSVVDSHLRVQGVEGLRVVDASVMPNTVRGNTNAPTIMIAERAADLIAGRTPERA